MLKNDNLYLVQPEEPTDPLLDVFTRYAGTDPNMDAEELMKALNDMYKSGEYTERLRHIAKHYTSQYKTINEFIYIHDNVCSFTTHVTRHEHIAQ